jgi:ADP-ribose pyrophosphatase YjhB (NUDIX family)
MRHRAAAIIIDKESLLLLHRIKEDREYWVLPGSSVEAGESDKAACHREVREETGLIISE